MDACDEEAVRKSNGMEEWGWSQIKGKVPRFRKKWQDRVREAAGEASELSVSPSMTIGTTRDRALKNSDLLQPETGAPRRQGEIGPFVDTRYGTARRRLGLAKRLADRKGIFVVK